MNRKRKIKAKTSADIQNDEPDVAETSTTTSDNTTTNKEEAAESEVCVFVKKRKVASSIRSRSKNPMFQTTATEKKQAEAVLPSTAPSKPSLPAGPDDQLATALNSIETKRDRDAVAIERRAKQIQKETRETGDINVYRGKAGYLDYLAKEDTSGQIKGAGIKAGPVRANLYARAITRWDYQPDICKDYKETGYCGYGDSCKFMHDRGDYKRGWELDKEWEEQQKAKAQAAKEGNDGQKPVKEVEDDGFPFACFVCRGPFVDPVKAKCGHYFCERCAVKQCKLNCEVCGKPTNSAFSVATKVERQKLEESAKRAAAAAEANKGGDDEDEEEGD